MNKTLLSSALVAVIAATAFAPTAQAASSGTINFTGRVLADTCVITVNGGAAVVLPTVVTGTFTGQGSVAGATSFTIALSNCDVNIITAAMAFAGTHIDPYSGNLRNTASGGSNVELQLLNNSSAPINTATNANAPVINVSGGTGSTQLTAQYVSVTTATTPGLVTSTVNFTLTYL